MKFIKIFTLSLFLTLFLQGCGPLTIVTTTFSLITTAQEIEEEYEGDFNDYVDDKLETTYEYVEEKVSQE